MGSQSERGLGAELGEWQPMGSEFGKFWRFLQRDIPFNFPCSCLLEEACRIYFLTRLACGKMIGTILMPHYILHTQAFSM